MANPNHHICFHGHFYQPPRENPWLGVIEPQPSAYPFRDWNARIADECYGPLTACRIYDEEGKVEEFCNCLRHLSFNVGPTLFSWLEKQRPDILRRILDADESHGVLRGGFRAALAQPYGHPILPLANARDRHTHILWGLREFQHRYGRKAEGMWLPECAVDRNTVRALIDHGVRFTILAPHQALAVRPFGRNEWRTAGEDDLDPRYPYRVFDVDGAGRTHFDRFLDVFFFDAGLSRQIGFEHLLQRPAALVEEVVRRFDEDATLPQLVLVAVDGEVFGHHERGGEETLAHFLNRTAPQRGIYISNLVQYHAENPPYWEVRLDFGAEGRGSSWSCSHGVARWEGDCGCQTGGREGWNQRWRTPLRQAIDAVRAQVAEALNNEGGDFFHDPWEARDDYIDVILRPDAETRQAFLARHAVRPLPAAEEVRAWELMEASRYGLLMYASCGWFFADLAGLEAVQNLRLAVRALELAKGITVAEAVARISRSLAEARSNYAGTGPEMMARHVLPTCYSAATVAAAHVFCRLFDLALPRYRLTVSLTHEAISGGAALGRSERRARGQAEVYDVSTGRKKSYGYYAVVMSPSCAGVFVVPTEEEAKLEQLAALSPQDLRACIESEAIQPQHLPVAERMRILDRLFAEEQRDFDAHLRHIGERQKALLRTYALAGVEPPSLVKACAEHMLAAQWQEAAAKAAKSGGEDEEAISRLWQLQKEASALGLSLPTADTARLFAGDICRRIVDFSHGLDVAAIAAVRNLVRLSRQLGMEAGAGSGPQEAFWHFLHGAARLMLQAQESAERRQMVEALAGLGSDLGFAPTILEILAEAASTS